MLQVVFPHALILGAVHMLVDTTSIGLVIGPVSVVNVAVDVDKSALAVSTVLTPLTTVLGTVGPGLLTEAVTESALPLACVDGTGLEGVGWSGFARLARVIQVLRNCFTGLFLSEVLAAS